MYQEPKVIVPYNFTTSLYLVLQNFSRQSREGREAEAHRAQHLQLRTSHLVLMCIRGWGGFLLKPHARLGQSLTAYTHSVS